MNLKDIIACTLAEERGYSEYGNYGFDNFTYENEYEDINPLEDLYEIGTKKKEIKENNEMNKELNNSTQNNNEGMVNTMNNNMMEMMMAQMQQMMEMNAKLTQQVAELTAQVNARQEAPVQNVKVEVPTKSVANITPVNENNEVKADRYESTVDRSRYQETRTISEKFDDVDWKELQRTNPEAINDMVDELRTNLLTSLNPNFYMGVLGQYRVELLQQYYMIHLLKRGQYSPENDNLDSMDRIELSNAIIELEIAEWEERQLRKGKNPFASAKQIELLKRNGIDTTNIKYWWEASPILEKIFGSYDNNPTTAQKTLIANLVKELGLQGYDMSCETKKDASAKIEELTKLRNEKFGDKKPTEAQITLYKQYLKLNNKRVTKKIEEKIENMSYADISNEITELKASYNNNHPECTEGQANYIKSLCDQLMIACDMTIVREMTKIEATNKIDELSRQLLYRKMRRTMGTVTMEEINKLTRDEVKAKLNEFRPNREQ